MVEETGVRGKNHHITHWYFHIFVHVNLLTTIVESFLNNCYLFCEQEKDGSRPTSHRSTLKLKSAS